MFCLYLILFWAALAALKPTRKLAMALLPWLIFACSYDVMRLFPNYTVNPIDVKDLFDAEKTLFGITLADGERLIPSQYFALHHCTFADIMAGLFYLCWVPVPLAFGIYLYLKGEKEQYLCFSIAFLAVNLIGFAGYYLHPAAPPWYAMHYGFEPQLHTPGNVAGLGRFDQLTGMGIFHALYSKNSNVFAAVPSLHAAYMLIATAYAVLSHRHKATILLFAFICGGIWWTAIYTAHHYIIDVLLGIVTAATGMTLWELFVRRTAIGKRFLRFYLHAVS